MEPIYENNYNSNRHSEKKVRPKLAWMCSKKEVKACKWIPGCSTYDFFCFLFWITLAPSESTCSTFFMNHSRALFLELHLENAFQGANVKDSEIIFHW